MRFDASILLLAAVASSSAALFVEPRSRRQQVTFALSPKSFRQSVAAVASSQKDLSSWVAYQSDVSFEGILANIGPDGANVVNSGVRPGVVVASPSKSYPDYFYHWIRDGAITIRALVDHYAATGDAKSKQIIDDYIASNQAVQRVSNPSGAFEGLEGLGEPKFHVDGSAFVDNWGRPQRDGPALRAITLINYIYALTNRTSSQASDYKYIYDQVIKPDLEYTSKFWAHPGFDLWEEVNGLHFFTAMVQFKALCLGEQIAEAMNDPGAAEWYRAQSIGVRGFLRAFWDDGKGHIVETLGSSRSGLDSAIILGAIHGGSESVYPLHSDSMIATLHSLVQDMRTRYKINIADMEDFNETAEDIPVSVGIGRYPEDVYAGGDKAAEVAGSDQLGNPWFLCTASVAHALYALAEHLALSDKHLVITNLTAPFYLPLIPSAVSAKDAAYIDFSSTSNALPTAVKLAFDPASKETQAIIANIVRYADGFMNVIRKHSDAEGQLSEQFDRDNGFMRGAKQLTWSFEAFWNAAKMREKTFEAIQRRREFFSMRAKL
ncbi:glucoamylase I precursor [Myxozyma melibiosi]|uniref:glucan 1,4-alpha-glucosidase n=1 Tax=Myxozyma melibiosi TaxID=54550 RepID=A0ABR1EY27_9ASCO